MALRIIFMGTPDFSVPTLNALIEAGVKIYSTGGTAEYLRGLGAEVNEVADLTAYPSILEGRVKTLHPKGHEQPHEDSLRNGP